jgi:hypothetical protein
MTLPFPTPEGPDRTVSLPLAADGALVGGSLRPLTRW